ncbi:TetR/AcrR family transcriptional regulator [Umezawaea sp.]|uniref:TetR/AcrR family transcriptional regulator n=1 Tax=Umezawaea sp. TaxID=1955258 RepID=UPI002ED0639A
MVRADARRNQERILEEARGAVGAGDTGITLNELARRAGVGVGTVYRLFPTHQAMLEAVVEDGLRAMVDRATAAAEVEDVAEGLAGFFRASLLHAVREPGLVSVLVAVDDAVTGTSGTKVELALAVSRLLDRGRAAGVVRSALTGEDLLKLLCGLQHAIAASGDDQAAVTERYLDLVLAGLGLPGRST